MSRAAFEQQWGNYILDAATNETDLYFPIVHSTNSTLLCNGCPYTDMAARGSAVGSAMLKAVRTGRYAAASPSAEMSMLFIPVFPRGFVVAGESPRHVVFSIYAWKYPRSIDPFSLQSLVFCVNFSSILKHFPASRHSNRSRDTCIRNCRSVVSGLPTSSLSTCVTHKRQPWLSAHEQYSVVNF